MHRSKLAVPLRCGSVIDPFVPQDEYNLAAERGFALSTSSPITFSGSMELLSDSEAIPEQKGPHGQVGWRMEDEPDCRSFSRSAADGP